MKQRKNRNRRPGNETTNETGQSLVLIALVIVILLAFAGLATDVGMLFARSSQFSSAVDAATLAGVVDLSAGLDQAEGRAEEFLDANRWPIAEAVSSSASESTTPLGYPEFNYTVTYPVETYFLKLLGFDDIPITRSASAAVFSRADMPTATQAELGILRTAGQYVYGPDSCSAQGDPISAKWSNSGAANPLHTEMGGKYTYRIRIPEDYGQDLIIQLFDPDSLNLRFGTGDVIQHTDGSTSSDQTCSTLGNGDSCFIPTGEPTTANAVWLRRLDETWYPTNNCPVRDATNPSGNTITRYDLYHLDSNGDRVDLSSFTSGAATDVQTDMRWVTPGVTSGIPSSGTSTFRVASGTISGMQQDDDGYYNIYMDVTATAGTSKNGWDVWAGSPSMASVLPADGNQRNLYILNNLNSVTTGGIEIYAQGYLPTNSYYFDPPKLPVAAVSQSLGGSALAVSVFDFESPAAGPFDFNYSTMSPSDRPTELAAPRTPECSSSTDCNNKWVEPPFVLPIPSRDSGVAFYGGYLEVNYSMNNDEHVWSVTLPLGRPFLTR